MSCWQVLGLECTTDTKAIKRAYAGKLKLHHPEDDPEGFRRVRQAYEDALRYAKYAAAWGVSTEDEPAAGQPEDAAGQVAAGAAVEPPADGSLTAEHKAAGPLERFAESVRAILASGRLRKDIRQWEDCWRTRNTGISISREG